MVFGKTGLLLYGAQRSKGRFDKLLGEKDFHRTSSWCGESPVGTMCAVANNHYQWEEVTKRAQGDEALWHGVVEDQSVANVRGLHVSPGDDGADGFRIPDE